MADFIIRRATLISCVANTKTAAFTIKTNVGGGREIPVYRIRLIPQSVTVGDLPTRVLIESFNVDGTDATAITPVAVDSANASATAQFTVNIQSVAPTTLNSTPYESYLWPQGQGDDHPMHPAKLTPLCKLAANDFHLVSVTAGVGAVTHNAFIELLVGD